MTCERVTANRGASVNVDAETHHFRHSEAAGRGIPYAGAHTQPWTREGRPLHRHPREDSPASDANTAKRIASEKEEQGSGRSFRRKAEAEPRGLCDDAIPRLVCTGNDNGSENIAVILALRAGIPRMVAEGNDPASQTLLSFSRSARESPKWFHRGNDNVLPSP